MAALADSTLSCAGEENFSDIKKCGFLQAIGFLFVLWRGL